MDRVKLFHLIANAKIESRFRVRLLTATIKNSDYDYAAVIRPRCTIFVYGDQ